MRVYAQLGSRLGPLYFYKEAIAIALPVMLQQFIMSMVSLIDNFMVAGLGDVSMAAVNVTNHLSFIYFVIMNTICQAGGIYIAQFRGADDTEGMKHAYRFKIIFATLAAVVFFVLCRTIPDKMIAMMTMGNAAQEEIIIIGTMYLNLISWTAFPIAISTAIATSFREIARPKWPLLVSAVATLVNTAGNWLLIYGNLGAPRLEVAGAAYATIIARITELGIFLIFVRTAKAPFFVGFTGLLNVRRDLVARILSKSAMIFVSELSWISAETLMMAMYNRRGGAEVVAGMAAGWTIANIFFLLMGGVWTASTVLVGGSLGANRLDEARRRAGWLKSGSVAAGVFIALPGAALSAFLIPIVFSNLSPDARSTCLGLVFVILAYLPLWALLNTQYAVSRAGGDTALGMYTDLAVNTFLFAPGSVLLSFFTPLSPVTMFAILKTSDFFKYFMARHLLKKEKWVRNLTG
jgi:putative MATE family efflux protein